MMHDGAFQYVSYIFRVSAPSIPKISFLPVLEPTEKISNTHTYAHTLHYYIDYPGLHQWFMCYGNFHTHTAILKITGLIFVCLQSVLKFKLCFWGKMDP